MCEEFSVLPAVALDAIENDEEGLIFRVIDVRDYSKSFAAFTEDQKLPMEKRRNSSGIERVRDIYWGLQKRLLAEKLAKANT